MKKPYALIFPGAPEIVKGMGTDIYNTIPEVKYIYEKVSQQVGFNVFSYLATYNRDNNDSPIQFQTASLVYSISMYEVILATHGILPAVMSGLSLGQFSAIYSSRMLDIEDVTRLTQLESSILDDMQKKKSGLIFFSYGIDQLLLKQMLSKYNGDVFIISENSPTQFTFGGTEIATKDLANRINNQTGGLSAEILGFPPVHSKLLEPYVKNYAQNLRELVWNNPEVPIIADTNAKILAKDNIVDQLCIQLISATHFVDSIREMHNMGIRHFVCIGPERNLSVFIRNTLKGIDEDIKIDTVTTLEDINQLNF